MSHEADLQTLIASVRLCRQILQAKALDRFRGEEMLPGIQVKQDREIAAYVRKIAEALYHPVGTCKMGNDPMAVVNSQLQVHGIRGLRVVDASIMPKITSGNTNAPTIAIAEKIASLLVSKSS
ncbi:GMC oxidoreductase [Mastigocoleus sp. MO_188.B34]|uniref:GMC oxidoreductase n=1 Tax=Mastigocoleus sp. MO_188.B34 TaxID=3036635 RepID=UPI0034522AFA